jgi:hypothetical protein
LIPLSNVFSGRKRILLSGNVSQLDMKNMTENYMIKGTIPVPRKAAVTGLLTWKYETCYKAQLHPSKYNYDVSYLDSITLTKSLDSKVALLQQHSETLYEATFSHVALGERKHVRIRYLLPNTGSGNGGVFDETEPVPELHGFGNGETLGKR